MSVRAYRVIKRELAETSFNLWHDTDILEFLENGSVYLDCRNSDGVGFIEVSVLGLKELLTDYKWKTQDYRMNAISADVAWADKHNEETVRYECF